MTQSVYTQQAPSSFKLNTLTTVANPSFQDELALAQAEAVAPTQDPLTSRDRRIIAEIIQAQPETIRTIWIEGGITVWVQFFDGGRLAFDRDWFAIRVASVKATLPETPLERNERLHEELSIICNKFGIQTGQIDWLSFSTKLYQDRQCIGLVGCNAQGLWYARRTQLGCNQFAHSAEIVVASLGVRLTVAA
ncbi:hypothetical protein [Komarekiella delphini-convector]|uniref:hypothetical protein n=1 Tax=Komarekiella delphini-convector TaxID=3050158 RepID=UPI001CD8D796|nr:hypothetical protein [Komarekiella delphini-convector]